ncbi:PspC domain-containing protein [Dokdonia sp. Hel_I_53]|uniref:PspC domain-containing protein n=1 Tax=Dokdonia sp. Hel_I_53 TaxID=1566287 RepID=UPI00119AF002|nr:PspC domain-containing protein [Dokdonia sp. Hel_I_53]TVZ53247.1 phage shock protein C (PspC) family protein [Dokdonia sp. Hel_I_53]
MNKTVNINLAGIFFHIDEDAYGKLQRYLAAIKSSFQGVQGEDEIIADIEARISELFSERVKDDRQVIGLSELDEVIAIMGQPEDYRVDDDIFEDETTTGSSSQSRQAPRISQRRFFRDTDNAYIGGVSSGMAHYLGIDPLWVRIGWVSLIVLTWFTLGGTALIYLALWVFVPEAQTTADKLAMRGKAVNIDNITEKVKEGFGNVADRVQRVDYDKYGSRVKTGAQGFFSTLSTVIMFFLKVLAKIVGVILIITGATVVISLLITFLTGGMVDIFTPNLTEMPWFSNDSGLPIWLVLLLSFLVIGIPFFFLFYLGLKILSSNMKSMPTSAKLSLLGVWLVAAITGGILAVQQAVKYADMTTGKTIERTELAITQNDTIRIQMQESDLYDIPFGRSNGYVKTLRKGDESVAIERDVLLIVRSTKDSTGYIKIEKRATNLSYDSAKELAESIDYHMDFSDNILSLDGFFTSPSINSYGRWNDREVRVIVYLPEGATLIADENTYSYHRNESRYRDILDNGTEESYLKVGSDKLLCETCLDQDREDWEFTDDDGWQERSYEEGDSVTNWNKTDTGVVLKMTQEKISLFIGANATENELRRVQEKLLERGVTLAYAGSTFRSDDKIASLTLSVTTNDGYDAVLTSSRDKLLKTGVKFERNFNETGKTAFIFQ